jgi:transposase
MTEQVLDRQQKHRLAVLRHAEEISGNVAATCRYYGISRQMFYTWQRRYDAEGVDGLKARSRRPKTSPNATHAEVVGKIIYLRQNYHFGPGKISMYLKRYHDVDISSSGVWRILKRLEMNRLPASQKHKTHDRRWKRYEKQLPGHRVQIDVKFVEPLPTQARSGRGKRRRKFYQFTAIDDCTRLRVLRIYPQLNQDTAIQFADYVLQRLPFAVEVIQTDIQRLRVRHRIPLAHPRQGRRPRLHQTPHPPPQRQGGEITPHRRRGVLPTPRRRRPRRRKAVQRQASRVRGLLQLPSTPRRSRRPDTLRTPTPKTQTRP